MAEQPVTAETQKSFDVLASVNMLRFDIEQYGGVLLDTKERVRDEELSYIAEAVNRSSRTIFDLKRNANGEMVYFSEGEWRPYLQMVRHGLAVARLEARTDNRREFLVDRAKEDVTHAKIMNELTPGERHTWFSPYPEQEEQQYGTEFIKARGFKPDRKMGLMYQAVCNEDGVITLESQTVDNSNEASFAAAAKSLHYDPEADLDVLTRAYDYQLMKQRGVYHFAGRAGEEGYTNIWHQLQGSRDLIEYHLSGLERIARLELPNQQLERIAKEHLFKSWALFANRFEKRTLTSNPDITPTAATYVANQPQNLEADAVRLMHMFQSQGRVPNGCGGSISIGGEDIFNADVEDVINALFGTKSAPEAYSFNKKMYCVVCQAPPEEKAGKKMCGPCGLCRSCDNKASLK